MPQDAKWNEPPEINLDNMFRKWRTNTNQKLKFSGSRFLIIIIVIWLLSGFYAVGPDEVGVVQRFGAFTKITNPGLNYRIPWPIEKVTKPQVTKVQRIEVGFRTIDPGPPSRYTAIPEESQMLSGDENIVTCEFIVQYKINDPVNWLFKVRDQQFNIKSSAEAAIREVVGRSLIDDVLTTGKQQIQDDTRVLLQEILNIYESGISILAVQLQDVHPPEAVQSAFKDVTSAKEDKSKAKNKAEAYENDLIPKARGDSSRIVNEALAYREEKIQRAIGDASRFEQILTEYRKAPQVTRKRIYLEALEEVFAKNNLYIFDENAGKGMIPLLPIKDMIKTIPPTTTTTPSQ
jgi:modulator of FtsH protease HflK